MFKNRKEFAFLFQIFLVVCTSAVGYYLDNREGYFEDRKNLDFVLDASVVSITVVGLFILIWLFEIHNRVMCFNFYPSIKALNILCSLGSQGCVKKCLPFQV